MKTPGNELRRDEILALAREAKLLRVDGKISYLNDMATDKELLAFARLLEERHLKMKAVKKNQESVECDVIASNSSSSRTATTKTTTTSPPVNKPSDKMIMESIVPSPSAR